MHKTKRFFATIVLLTFFFVTTMSGYTLPVDIQNHWAKDSLKPWIDNGIIKGYADGTIKPNSLITRSEFTAILDRIFKFIDTSPNIFSDVKDGWYKEPVLKAYKAGIITGYDNNLFKPAGNLSRQEASVMIGRAFDLTPTNPQSYKTFKDSAKVGNWASEFVSALSEKGYIKGRGDNSFDPGALITRAEAFTILSNILKEIIQTKSTIKDKTINGSLLINTPGVTLEDIKITGDLILSQGIGDGEVILDNVTVTGRTLVKGGGENSIILRNTSLTNLIVIKQNGKVRILSTGNTNINSVSAQSGVKLQGNGFKNVEVIRVPAGQNIELDGDFENVNLDAPSVDIIVTGGKVGSFEMGNKATDSKLLVSSGTVSNLSVKAKSSINLKGGFVTNLDLTPSAKNTNIKVEGSTVNSLNIGTEANITMTSGLVNKVSASTAATNSKLTVDGAKVNEIETGAKIDILATSGDIGTLDILSTATDTNIQINKTANVSQLQTEAKLSVEGNGAPEVAIIKASGVTMETKPATVNIIGDVSANIAGENVNDTNDDSDTITEKDDPDNILEPSPSTSTSTSPSLSPSTSPSPSQSTQPSSSIQPSQSTQPSPSPSPSPKQDITYTSISINTSGDDQTATPATDGSATLDVSANNDTDLIQNISLTTNASELYVVNVISENMGTMAIQDSITSGFSNIEIANLLGSGNTDLTIGTLRNFIGKSLIINGILKNGTNYNNKTITITLNLSTENYKGTYENEYIEATSSGKTITASIKNSAMGTRVSNIGIIDTINTIFGQIPESVSTDSLSWHTPTIESSAENELIKDAIAELASTELDTKTWNTVEFSDLAGKKLYFKKKSTGDIYTILINLSSEYYSSNVNLEEKTIKASIRTGKEVGKLSTIGITDLFYPLLLNAPDEFSTDNENWRVFNTDTIQITTDLETLTGKNFADITLYDLGNETLYLKYGTDVYTLNMIYFGYIPSSNDYWVGSWATAPQLTETSNLPPSPGLSNNTLRQVIYTTLSGNHIRLKFSNEYGNAPLTMNAVYLAVSGSSSSTVADTSTQITFGANPSVTIPAGETVVSDVINYELPALTRMSISIYFGSVPSDITGHPGSRTTSYIKAGNVAESTTISSPATTDHWYVITGIDVLKDPSSAAIAILGDSITDGRGSTTNANNRWPDNLARLLKEDEKTYEISVLNQGIGGNAVLSGGLGPTALVRYDRDILEQSGVRWAIILEGVNDIGGSSSQTVAQNLIVAYEEFIEKAHDKGILVYGITILPFGGSQYASTAHESARQTVNNWIKTSGKFDAVIDLATEVSDPSNRANLLSTYDSGDHLHLNVAGYQKMAEMINLELFYD